MSIDLDFLDDIQQSINNISVNRFEFLKTEQSQHVPEGINYLVNLDIYLSKAYNYNLEYTFLYPMRIGDDHFEQFFIKKYYVSIPGSKTENINSNESKRYTAQILNIVKWTNEFIGIGKNSNVKNSIKLIKDVLKERAYEVDIYHTVNREYININYKSVKVVNFKYLEDYNEFITNIEARKKSKNEVDAFVKENNKTKVYEEDNIPF